MQFVTGDHVCIVGFTRYPRSVYNDMHATVMGFNPQKKILLVKLNINGDLVVIKEHHLVKASSEEDVSSDAAVKELQIHQVETCAICMSNLSATPRVQTQCKHVFHDSCLQRWTNVGSSTCPICRQVIRSNAGIISAKSAHSVCESYAIELGM